MKIMKNNISGGFTLLELMVVIAILGILTSIALPNFVSYRERAKATCCLTNRYQIENDERCYFMDNDERRKTIESPYSCPSGGVYLWLKDADSDPNDPDYLKVVCSIHGPVPSEAEEKEEESEFPEPKDTVLAEKIEKVDKKQVVPKPKDRKLAKNIQKVTDAALKYYEKRGSFNGFFDSYKSRKKLKLHNTVGKSWPAVDSDDVMITWANDSILVLEGYSPEGYLYRTVIDQKGESSEGEGITNFESSISGGEPYKYEMKKNP